MNYRGKGGRWLTVSLFKGVPGYSTDHAVFSRYHDTPGLINARKTFVALQDPTGYKWAMEYLGDYDHWLALMKCDWFQEMYDRWMQELKSQMRSDALIRIQEIAKGDTAAAIGAAKYLATYDWEKATRGRPSKAELSTELRKQIRLAETVGEDAERIGLVKAPKVAS